MRESFSSPFSPGFHSTCAYVGMHQHTSRTRSGAWASQHHLGTSRVHWSHSAPPPRVRTHPPTRLGSTTRSHHSLWEAPSIFSSPTQQVCTYPSLSGGLGSLSTTTLLRVHTLKSGHPYKPILKLLTTAPPGLRAQSSPCSTTTSTAGAQGRPHVSNCYRKSRGAGNMCANGRVFRNTKHERGNTLITTGRRAVDSTESIPGVRRART